MTEPQNAEHAALIRIGDVIRGLQVDFSCMQDNIADAQRALEEAQAGVEARMRDLGALKHGPSGN